MNKKPIGVFDSGYGGLTVLKEICKLMPEYDFVYLGDNERAPYGPLPFETVYDYTLEAVKWFFKDHDCPLVILACNTASAKALRTIQQNDLPNIDPSKRVLGVIRPTSEVIEEHSNSKHIGILATVGTVQSASYLLEIQKFHPDIFVSQQASPEWVELVEDGKQNSSEADAPVKMHIENLLSKDKEIDCILLACTHYPLLLNKIKQFVPQNINIISQGEIVANSLKKYLENHSEIDIKCSKTRTRKFFTTGNEEDFNSHATLFFGDDVAANKIKL
ncbi:MAG: glutamate racemase [Ferruginibacter sp.]|nr:glutamate racemase [Ferruginibacter sp.]